MESRALGFLGYGSSKSVASREEVQEAERRRGGATFTQEARDDRAFGARLAEKKGNGTIPPPVCNICGATGRLGKDGKFYVHGSVSVGEKEGIYMLGNLTVANMSSGAIMYGADKKRYVLQKNYW